MSKKGKKIFVNLLSLSRIVGAILIPIVFNNANINALIVIIIFFFISDTLDGLLARTWKVQTYGGRLLDPLGDKVLAISCILALINANYLLIILLILEILISIINVYRTLLGEKVKSSIWGKIKTWPLSITLVLEVIYVVNFNLLGFTITNDIVNILVYITLVMQIITMIDYIKESINTNTKKEKIAFKSFNDIITRLFDEESYLIDKNKSLVEIISK